MNKKIKTFKEIAYQILKEGGKPLHIKEITKIALEREWLNTAGKTPEATMNAQLIVDINSKKDKSRFIKTDLSIFGLNPDFKEPVKKTEKARVADKIYKISKGVSTKQKGDIAEARIAELITLLPLKSRMITFGIFLMIPNTKTEILRNANSGNTQFFRKGSLS